MHDPVRRSARTTYRVVLALMVATNLAAAFFVCRELLSISGFRPGRLEPNGPSPHARCDVIRLKNACADFYLDVGRFPAVLTELVDGTGIEKWDGPYVERAQELTDPWRRLYRYRPSTRPDEWPDVFTLGADGRPGGRGANRDLHSADQDRRR